MDGKIAASIVTAAIVLWVTAQYVVAVDYPLFAEDYTEIAVMRTFRSVWEVFTTNHPPPRPLQHLEFYAATHWTSTAPWAMRLPAFVLHMVAIVGVGALARALGFEPRSALAAAGLYALYPATVALVYPASMGMVGRTPFAIWALAALVASARHPGFAPLAVLSAGIALLFHQSAVVLVPIFFLFGALHCLGSCRRLVPCVAKQALHPAVLGFACVAAVFLLLTRDSDSPHTSLRSLTSMASNAVKAMFGVFPEEIRHFVVEAMRGRNGTAGFTIAAALCSLVAIGVVAALVRGTHLVRFCVLGIAFDLALPIATAGYSQRYTLLAGALAAILAVDLVKTRRRWVPIVVLLGAAWCHDTVRATFAAHQAGRTVARLLDVAADQCARLPTGKRLVVCDLPLTWGRERDLMVFHWGFSEALAERGVRGAFAIDQIRTRAFPGEARARLVDAATVAGLREDQGVVLLEYDSLRRDFAVSRTAGVKDNQPR